jgi:tRNA(fMet)-specific endonuclease VapC
MDTSVLVLSLRGDGVIRARLAATTQLYIPSIALGELYFGARGSPTRASAARADVASLAANYPVLGTDAATADIYAQIKHDLRTGGRVVPENDLWIAATALQYDVTLTAREAHFDWIDGLRVEQWRAQNDWADAQSDLPIPALGSLGGLGIGRAQHFVCRGRRRCCAKDRRRVAHAWIECRHQRDRGEKHLHNEDRRDGADAL